MMPSAFLPSRTQEWQPESADECLDHLRSVQQIQQLPVRYALAVDSRDMDALAELFVEDVQVGKQLYGRDEFKRWMTEALGKLGRTVHLVANHILSFRDADHAVGVVYCRDEVEHEESWTVGHLQYWDTYERRAGRWHFVRRLYNRWAVVDEIARSDSGFEDQGLTTRELPQAWPTWDRFHNRIASSGRTG